MRCGVSGKLCKKINKKMAQMMELPLEVLNSIMVILAMSCNGAKDLARASATCKTFMTLARQSDILKVVNFQSLTSTDDYGAHHHANGLLCQCARAGNLAAESMLGKALLNNDTWFWNMILENDQPPPVENGSSSGVLRHQRLVRSFICHASCEELAPMRIPLFSYVISFVGHDVACACGILHAITNMCSYEIMRLRIRSSINAPENVVNNESSFGLNHELARLTPPPGVSHQDRVLVIFDILFPSSSM